MESRLYSSDIIYPFVPGDRSIMPYKKGLVDCLFIIDKSYPAGPTQPPPSRIKVEWYGLECAVGGNTYNFRYVLADGTTGLLSFFIPVAAGFVRASDGNSLIVVNSDIMYSGPIGPVSLPYVAEIEPARIMWRLDEVESVALVNEERRYNPTNRANLANTTVANFNTDGAVIKLVDGYNCSLSYDQHTETLTINAAPGEGKGLPANIPWDDTPPDIDNGIKTINGIGYTNDVGIIPGASFILNKDGNKLIFTALKDTGI